MGTALVKFEYDGEEPDWTPISQAIMENGGFDIDIQTED